ncbi:hypothetical protein TPHA_0I02560 [Tetrapisispora phaffii CBS 4417]|uniref:BOD1/SHG1 domain-containing protein n=1 Tax=Tetrapisispora phaffii (strain ATCC 24235 / CBS 4417 / NBRC 1672 / NRRL Y-8282 / UCD 70-5) TaxID=1071381 RepID=G8BXX9_TETPH|nr:hypothetical protein TPHA_0I02560 [Tetrapisispora phaffii CBS 4417]CCE64757.1 hypothetical protein TPHA_0I02560 [Tetrapisispora phaffii CBS 4417]
MFLMVEKYGIIANMSGDTDKAQELADLFKKHGYFDKLKQDILNKRIENGEQSAQLQELVKLKVAQIVNEMVNSNEDLIFKNRGSTTALIEGQIVKDGYAKLNTGENGINLTEVIEESMSSEDMKNDIFKVLENLDKDLMKS